MPHIMALCAWLKGNGHTALGIGCQDGMFERDSAMRLWRAFLREVCGHWMRLSATSHIMNVRCGLGLERVMPNMPQIQHGIATICELQQHTIRR